MVTFTYHVVVRVTHGAYNMFALYLVHAEFIIFQWGT